MKAQISAPIDFERPISRSTVVSLLYTALRLKQYRFVRQSALLWLATFPGDLEINLVLAQAMYGEERFLSIATIVDDLCAKDPEFLPAQQLRAQPQITKNQELRTTSFANLFALNGSSRSGVTLPEWANLTWEARQAYLAGNLEKAEQLIHQALVTEPPSPIAAILHMQIARAGGDRSAQHNLAEVYHTRWPDCLHFKLYLAETLVQSGDEAGSVSLLHQCASQDAVGQVATRVWGQTNPYRSLWPTQMEIMFDIPVPATLAAAMGWNQLSGGPQPVAQPVTHHGDPKAPVEPNRMPADMLRQIQDEFERIGRRLRLPGVGRTDGRFPVYVILSTKRGLENLYGPQTASVLQVEMKNLASAIRKQQTWDAISFLPDDPNSAASNGVKPVPYNDPWKIKLTLTDLDAALAKKGEMIGAVLILGGPEIVPFHRLPNPTNDDDPDVASDNPYASLDQNYFIPDWPVGRLPGGSSSDAGLLLASLRRLTAFHIKQSGANSWFRNRNFLRNLLKPIKRLLPKALRKNDLLPSFGYSAAVWKPSSQAVFRAIGDPSSLVTCPPASGVKVSSAHLTYFNLHGLGDGPDWYGQRDANDASGSPDYPVALSPKDISQNSLSPRIVYSEACYGNHIENLVEDQSIALKFMSAGCLAMVGSTCISYGSVTTPLIGADLLGSHFWKNIKAGKNAGEAFQQAKISLVNEMNKRQGYLDGEDQKTLISFILYGDPLAISEEYAIRSKSVTRLQEHPIVRAISDLMDDKSDLEPVPAEMLGKVKKLVGQYLPGLQDAELIMSPQHAVFDEEGHAYAVPQMGKKQVPQLVTRNTVVRLSKRVEFARHVHHHYARLTLDSKGRLLKLTISR
ncbi:MAG: C25 family cysteine peptidase [Anaerolineaceae bacterium]|nr:C25 family cysteine peptidase [Anaerolineaceae bacterium]